MLRFSDRFLAFLTLKTGLIFLLCCLAGLIIWKLWHPKDPEPKP